MKLDISSFLGIRTQFILIPAFILIFSLSLFWLGNTDNLSAEPLDKIASDTRCPVCGMFVAKYDVWITQVKIDKTITLSFDGVKDMMAFQFSPGSFGHDKDEKINETWVKDYYSLKWIDGLKAYYVQGSDVHGPMGHELIPFSSRAAAESFMADHKGMNIYTYSEITKELIDTLRSGYKMKK